MYEGGRNGVVVEQDYCRVGAANIFQVSRYELEGGPLSRA